MKIVKIDIQNLCIPLKIPYVLSKANGTKAATSCVLVTLHTDEGIWGVGECNPQPGFTEESAESAMCLIAKVLGPAIMGMDPTDIGAIVQKMDKVLRSNNLPKAAIDTACYDIAGKASGVPVYKLLGGKLTDEIKIMNAIGNDPVDMSVSLALEKKKQGNKALMVKVGAVDNVMDDVKRIIAIREAVGSDYPLIADANQGWDYHETIRFLRETEQCKLALLEQPVPFWDLESLARIKENTDVPISADESVFSTYDAVRLIKQKAVDCFSIKINKHGGIYKAKEIMTLAKNFGIKCLMNSMLEEGVVEAASLALGCTQSNLVDFGHAYFSPTRLAEDISDYSDRIQNGWVHVPDKPGLGIELYEDIIAKYQVDALSVTAD